MKKVLVIFGLLMAAFSFQTSAATLSWVGNSGTVSPQTSGSSPFSLFGEDGGINKNSLINADWTFNLSSASTVFINISSLKVKPTWLSNVTLNGNVIPQNVAADVGSWLFQGFLAAGDHTIHLGGIANGNNSGYQMNVQTPIPAAVWLFGSALMGMMGISRRKKA